jgi:hypothetical protein
LALALHHADWIRPLGEWLPPRKNARRTFASLAQHLLALSPVPAFMTSAWFELPRGEVLPQHHWYKHLGRGHNVRALSLPLRMTSAMAHMFALAPGHFTAVEALRWSQVRGLGGSETLARMVAGTRLGKVLEHEEFWESAILFFINHPLPDSAVVGHIVDFLQHRKFQSKPVISANGVYGGRPPPCPDYTMKGQTVFSLLWEVRKWRRQEGREASEQARSWQRSPFTELKLVERSEAPAHGRIWTIAELLTGRALVAEGHAMRHCVATYAGRCLRRATSIWSMKVKNRSGRHRVLTIEVNLATGTVCQVRGRRNRLPRADERKVVERWAAQEGMVVDGSVWS